MELFIYSFYDKVSKQSICLNFYRDNQEARREAKHVLSQIPPHRLPDVDVRLIGYFNTETLCICDSPDHLVILSGSDFSVSETEVDY